LKDDYKALIKNCFKSEIDQVDFQNQLEQTRQKVNQFISEKTQEKIPELFKQGDLTTDDRLVLANALYFKASWQKSFSKGSTKQDTFYRNGQTEQTVQFMHETATLRHASNDDVAALELPYDDQDLGMLIVLPNSRDGMRDLEQKLTGEQLRDIVSRFGTKTSSSTITEISSPFAREFETIVDENGIAIVVQSICRFQSYERYAIENR